MSEEIASRRSSGLGSLRRPGIRAFAVSGSFFLISSKAKRLAFGGCDWSMKYSPSGSIAVLPDFSRFLAMTSAAERNQLEAIGPALSIASKIIINESMSAFAVIFDHASAASLLPLPSGPTDKMVSIESVDERSEVAEVNRNMRAKVLFMI